MNIATLFSAQEWFVKLNENGKTYDLYREAYNCYTADDLVGEGLTKAELHLEYMLLTNVVTYEQFLEMSKLVK